MPWMLSELLDTLTYLRSRLDSSKYLPCGLLAAPTAIEVHCPTFPLESIVATVHGPEPALAVYLRSKRERL
jgi:hypothetical protein